VPIRENRHRTAGQVPAAGAVSATTKPSGSSRPPTTPQSEPLFPPTPPRWRAPGPKGPSESASQSSGPQGFSPTWSSRRPSPGR
jgi:hypothetical protein